MILHEEETEKFFPLFINLRGRKISVIGGGRIAERRILKLLPFHADITIISPSVSQNLSELIYNGQIKHICRNYEKGDIAGSFLAIAATNDRDVNHSVMMEAEDSNILIITADCRKECSCYFPAVIENTCYIAGLVSKNGNHKAVVDMAKQMRGLLNDE